MMTVNWVVAVVDFVWDILFASYEIVDCHENSFYLIISENSLFLIIQAQITSGSPFLLLHVAVT